MRHNKRTATTFPAQDASMMAGHGRVVREQHAHTQDKSYGLTTPTENPISRGYENPNSRSPETPNLRRPADLHSHVGVSGLGNGRNVADTASRDSTYLGQVDDVHIMRSAYNDAQERHARYGTNAVVVNRDSMASPLERGSPRPDAGSPYGAKAGVMNRMPPNCPFAATNQKLTGDLPQKHNSTSLAQEYHVRKARIHASLWQQEIRKQAGNLKGNADFVSSDSMTLSSNSREGKESFGWDTNKTMPEDWECFDPPEGEFYDESPGKEEALMFEEFEKRRERNRIKIASFVKQHLYGRRRPVDGWKYIINNFGTDSKAAKGSAMGGRQTTGNDLEKLALKRESGQLRRKV